MLDQNAFRFGFVAVAIEGQPLKITLSPIMILMMITMMMTVVLVVVSTAVWTEKVVNNDQEVGNDGDA